MHRDLVQVRLPPSWTRCVPSSLFIMMAYVAATRTAANFASELRSRLKHAPRRCPAIQEEMKLISTALIFLAALYFLSAQETLDPAKMSEAALLAKARQLVQEEFELSRLAARQAGTEKVRQFAERSEKRLQELDAELTTRAAGAGVTEPTKISESMQQRLSAIEKIQGAAFDPDYLDMLADMQGNNVAVLEELAKRADDPKLRDLARDAAAAERAQRDAARKLLARDVPDAK